MSLRDTENSMDFNKFKFTEDNMLTTRNEENYLDNTLYSMCVNLYATKVIVARISGARYQYENDSVDR